MLPPGKQNRITEIKNSGLSYAILRPTVLYSLEDILINNITYLLRTFPIFAMPENGEYHLQPVYVDDMADLAVAAGANAESITLDAVGPEVFSFNELLRLVAERIGRRARLIDLHPSLVLPMVNLIARNY